MDPDILGRLKRVQERSGSIVGKGDHMRHPKPLQGGGECLGFGAWRRGFSIGIGHAEREGLSGGALCLASFVRSSFGAIGDSGQELVQLELLLGRFLYGIIGRDLTGSHHVARQVELTDMTEKLVDG